MDNKRKLIKFYFIAKGECSSHYHQNLELFYVLNGELKITIDDTQFVMKKGDIILINANKRHLVNAKDDFLGVRFEIDFHLLAEIMGSMNLLFWCNTIADKNAAYDELRSILDQILMRYFEKDDRGALHLNALYYEALHILTSNFLIKSDDTKLYSEDLQELTRVRQIQNYIQANYQTQISLNDLAEKLYLSSAYLSKYVKKHIGLTFMEYLNNVRLFHAVDELLYTNKNITRIALDNGFPTSAAFTKIFRNIYSESPSEYRKHIKQMEEPESESGEMAESESIRIQKYLKLREQKREKDVKYQSLEEIDVRLIDHQLNLPSKAICIGEASLVLQSDVQKQLKDLQAAAEIQYARIWNVFSEEIYFNEKKGWNFRRIDRIIDFLLENHMKPYLEMGVKQTVFMYTPEKILKEGQQNDDFSVDSYKKIGKEFIIHALNRYGIDEIETWYFECWHHPKLSMEEDGSYYEYFEALYRTLKSVSPNIKVGGAGLILGYETIETRNIFRVWKARQIQPDFLTVYSYQYIAMEENGQLYGRKSIDSDYMKNQIDILKQIMRECEFVIPELHISEWNFTVSNRNLLNDSCEQGAYVLKNCIDTEDKVDMMAYWHALDIYSDYFDASQILNGDSGMISRDGIRKPSFYAYMFMNRLLPNVLKKDEHCIVTSDGRDNYVIACHNFKKLSSQYVFKEEDEIHLEDLNNYIEDAEPLELHFRLKNVKDGEYLVKIHSVNKENGSVQDIWKRLGYRKNLTKDEMNYLEKTAIPWMEIETIQGRDGEIDLKIVLKEQEIRMLEIQYYYTVKVPSSD